MEKKVKLLQKIKQPKQRSKKWFEMRGKMITASATADAIGESKYKAPLEFVVEKAGFPSYQDSEATHHGVKYENIATLIYSERNNVKVAEFGLLPHPKYSFLGASPDGICSNKTLDGKPTDLVGRMLEIKCPLSREIKTEGDIDGDICPHYYFIQVQVQLDVCDLDDCDFLQCKLTEYASRDEYIEDDEDGKSAFTGLEHGCVLRFLPKNNIICTCCPHLSTCSKTIFKAKYIYPPSSVMCLDEVNEFIVDALQNYSDNPVRFDIYEGYGKQTKNVLTIVEDEERAEFTKDLIGGKIVYASGKTFMITGFKNKNTLIVSGDANLEESFSIYYNEYVFDKVLYWRVELLTITLIKREPEWIKKNVGLIRKTWDYVVYYKSNEKKLLELKKIYDRYQTKFCDKKDLIKYSHKIMEEHIKGEQTLDEIVYKYLISSKVAVVKPTVNKTKFNESLFLEDSE